MASDDLPLDALERQFQLEDSSVSPVTKRFFSVLSAVPLPKPLDKIVSAIKERHSADSAKRIALMLTTIRDELQRLSGAVNEIYGRLSEGESKERLEKISELLLDGARKAEATRSLERVRRIGLILAGATIDPHPVDADEIEEMMRVAMELSDQDVKYLAELVRVEGPSLAQVGHLLRYDAYKLWEGTPWGQRRDSELDSVFSKLESYGLVFPHCPAEQP